MTTGLPNKMNIMTAFICLITLAAFGVQEARRGNITSAANTSSNLVVEYVSAQDVNDNGDEENQVSQDEQWINLFSTLVGAAIGFLGSWFIMSRSNKATEIRENQRRNRELNALRLSLRLEIDQNLQILEEEVRDFDNRPDDASGSEWLRAAPAAMWATSIFENSTIARAQYLTQDEIIQVQRFYASLNKLTMARKTLLAASFDKGYLERNTPWAKWTHESKQLLNAGNPLNDQDLNN